MRKHDIANAVVQNINQLCQCGLSAECITESAFQCFANSEQQMTFRARLHGAAQVISSQLTEYLGTFVFRTDSMHHCCARFASGCGQQLFHTFGDSQCTPSTTTSDSTATEAALPDNTAATVGCCRNDSGCGCDCHHHSNFCNQES